MTIERPARAAAALLAGAALLLTPAPARADTGTDFRWTVQPSGPDGPTDRGQFGYDLAPGQQIDDRAAVTNLSKKPLQITVYATDAATTADGSFTLLPAARPAVGAGRWISLPRRTYTVRPGGRVIVPFRLTVPKGAAPGDHAAGVLASVVEQGTDAGGQRVAVDRRVAARVYLRVTGPIVPGVQVTGVSTRFDNPLVPFRRGAATLTYRVRNTGNVRAGGPVTLRATGLFGAPLADAHTRTLPDLLPGAEVELTDRIDGVLPAGMITGAVVVDAVSSEGPLPTQLRTASTWTVPWTVLTVAVLLGAGGVALRRRRRAAGGPAGASGAVPAGDGATAVLP